MGNNTLTYIFTMKRTALLDLEKDKLKGQLRKQILPTERRIFYGGLNDIKQGYKKETVLLKLIDYTWSPKVEGTNINSRLNRSPPSPIGSLTFLNAPFRK